MIPLGRLAETREVAATVAYLLGDGASYATGENIAVDGSLLRASLDRIPIGRPFH
jgi:NAD(P)-dependent dehydrogenase (short-subunit alcohol dehydrogenase family)